MQLRSIGFGCRECEVIKNDLIANGADPEKAGNFVNDETTSRIHNLIGEPTNDYKHKQLVDGLKARLGKQGETEKILENLK